MEGTTIVSSFLCNMNSRPDRDLTKYIEYGKKLIAAPIQKIIFIDKSIIDQFSNDERTYLIPIEKSDIYLYEYLSEITNFSINTTYSPKDTLDYMIMICNKTDFMRRAIELNPYKSSQFIWLDFAINHIFSLSDEQFQEKVAKLANKSYSNVRIGSIWNLSMIYSFDIYKDVNWYFAGGVFGGDANALIKFADLTKEMCLQIIKERKTLMWEVNVWYLVYCKNKELFSPYQCNHNFTLIENY